MSQVESYKHYAKFRNHEVIILGYNVAKNSCLVCNLATLPMDDQKELRLIASSMVGQKQNYLAPLLQKERHKSGRDWFTVLAEHLKKNNGVVFDIPIKELEELNPEQKGVFKGYKKPLEEKQSFEDIRHAPVNEYADEESFASHRVGIPGQPMPHLMDSSTGGDPAVAQLSQKFDLFALTLVEELRALRGALAPAAAAPVLVEAPVRKKPGRKPASSVAGQVKAAA